MSPALRILLVVLFAIATPLRVHAQQPLTVFAAASLKESMDQASAAYQKDTGTPVKVSLAASSALARQIEQGAPADVFISADLAWMDYLQERKLVDADARRNLLGNSLVLIAPKASKVKVDPAKSGSITKALGTDGHLAVGQTSSVPAGKYAKQALQSLGQWDSLSGHLAEADSVRAALMLVSRGEAPLGIVYGSDAKADPGVRVVATFPESSYPPIIYPAAPLKNAQDFAAAEAFVAWLAKPEARKIFESHGFTIRK